MTLFYEGAPRTDYSISYVTYYTWATVWVAYVVPLSAALLDSSSPPFLYRRPEPLSLSS